MGCLMTFAKQLDYYHLSESLGHCLIAITKHNLVKFELESQRYPQLDHQFTITWWTIMGYSSRMSLVDIEDYDCEI